MGGEGGVESDPSVQYDKVQAGNYMFKVNIRNTWTSGELCSKLTIKTPERYTK